mgnify:CR=1 FL=1
MTVITINLVIGEAIQKISLLVKNNIKMKNIVAQAVPSFNSEFTNSKALFKLKNEPENFILKASKKTGFPKLDYPSFDPDAILIETGRTSFSLVWREKPSDFNIYFDIAKKSHKKKECQGCYLI